METQQTGDGNDLISYSFSCPEPDNVPIVVSDTERENEEAGPLLEWVGSLVGVLTSMIEMLPVGSWHTTS